MLFCPWNWRVVEVPFLGALAQSGAMVLAIASFTVLGPAGATIVLILAAIVMLLTNHLPTMMSCLVEIPVVWSVPFALSGNSFATIGILGTLAITNSAAAGVTCWKEPSLDEPPRFMWQTLASGTVFSSCIAIQKDFSGPAIWVAGIGWVILWFWALFAQSENT